MDARGFEEMVRRVNAVGISAEEAERNMRQRVPPLSDEERAAIDARLSRHLPLRERAFCFVLDTLTRAVDAFTRWIQR